MTRRRSIWQRHLGGVLDHLRGITRGPRHGLKPGEKVFLFSAALVVMGGAAALTLLWSSSRAVPPDAIPAALLDTFLPQDIDLTLPVRAEPRRFSARTWMPVRKEEEASGGLQGHFIPRHDLVRVDDPRVWWESDNDRGDDEDDHLMHRALEEPLRRLIELVVREGGRLKVQDIYRESGIHSPKSLHKEGRAVDLTCDELDLERLAKLAWMAGFDWVYNEWPRNGGAHVHASVRAHRPVLDHGATARD